MVKVKPSAREISRLRPSGALVTVVEQFLQDKYPSRRRPSVAASVLALILELYERDEPFPQRAMIAEAIGCSVFGIDAALSQAAARDLLTLEIRLQPGNVEQRDSSIKERYYIPSKQLLILARSARASRSARAVPAA